MEYMKYWGRQYPLTDDIKRVKAVISEYYEREFGEPAKDSDFENLPLIALCYTTSEDESYEIRVFADVQNLAIIKEGGEIAGSIRFKSIDEFVEYMSDVTFDDLISLP